jgi:hypothetical protein
MRDIICAGCSHTSFRKLDYMRVQHGHTPPVDAVFTNGSYPEVIHRNFGNKVYNAGLMSNSIASSVLSTMSIASRLLREGNNNFSIILQATDFERQHLYVSDEVKHIKGININSEWPANNNYLFNDNLSGFLQMGGMAKIDSKTYSDCKVILEMGKAYSKYIYSNENCTINALTHLILLQNFCKVNNIPYKIFKMMDLFSSPIFPFFELDYTNSETYFKSFFIDRKLPKKEPLGYIKSDEYIYDLFQMLDLDNMWFYSDDDVKHGGFFEWVYKNNEYKEGDLDYIALYKEDVVNPDIAFTVSDDPHRISIDVAKEKMKKGLFRETSHPTYYYWNKFVNEVMIDWDIFINKKSMI